jgi:hypothetical protein
MMPKRMQFTIMPMTVPFQSINSNFNAKIVPLEMIKTANSAMFGFSQMMDKDQTLSKE